MANPFAGLFGQVGGGTGFGGLLDPRWAALGGAAQALTQAGGPTRMPVSTGAAMANAMANATANYRQAQAAGMQQQMNKLQYQNALRAGALAQQQAKIRSAVLSRYLGGRGSLPGVGTPLAPTSSELVSAPTGQSGDAFNVSPQMVSSPQSMAAAGPPPLSDTDAMRLALSPDIGKTLGEFKGEARQRQQDVQSKRQSMLDTTTKWRKEYDKKVNAISPIVNMGMRAQDILKLPEIGPTAQLETLYSFITALDPESVVREGEVKLGRQAQSLIGSIMLQIDRITKGGIIDPKVAKTMAERIIQLSDRARGRINVISDKYRALAIRHQYDPKDVVMRDRADFNNAEEG